MPDPKQPDVTLPADNEPASADADVAAHAVPPVKPRLEPTRYGDWELKGKCVDF